MIEQFDSATKQVLLLNSFYTLIALSFDNYLGLVLPEILFGKSSQSGNESDYSWDSNSFIYGFLLESWFNDMFNSEAVDKNLLLEICASMSTSLLLFLENMSRDSPFDRKSKAAQGCLEKIFVEVRDVTFKIVTMIFDKQVEQGDSPSFVAKGISCLRQIGQILEVSTPVNYELSKQLVKPNLVHLINSEKLPVYLKKDVLLYFIKVYPDSNDLKDINFDSLLSQAQR